MKNIYIYIYILIKIGLTLIYLNEILPMKSSEFEFSHSAESYPTTAAAIADPTRMDNFSKYY